MAYVVMLSVDEGIMLQQASFSPPQERTTGLLIVLVRMAYTGHPSHTPRPALTHYTSHRAVIALPETIMAATTGFLFALFNDSPNGEQM